MILKFYCHILESTFALVLMLRSCSFFLFVKCRQKLDGVGTELGYKLVREGGNPELEVINYSNAHREHVWGCVNTCLKLK